MPSMPAPTFITPIEAALLRATIPGAQVVQSFAISDDDADAFVDQRRLCAARDFEGILTSLPQPCDALECLTVAAAHLCLFLQHNIAGPITQPPIYAPELSLDGEDASLLVATPHHLAGAYRLLIDNPPPTPPPTFAWWALRCCVLRQRVLANPSATLAAHMQRLAASIQYPLPNPALCIELALAHHLYGHVADAAHWLELAEQHSGVTLQVDGAMGVRTAHQQDAKAQLVVRVDGGVVVDEEDGVMMTDGEEPQDEPELDVLPLPVITALQNTSTTTLPLLAQALLLAHAKHIERATAADELRSWQMAPFVEAVLAQPRTTPAIYYTARLFRARHERARSRTRARALLAYQRLLSTAQRDDAHNLLFACTTPLPFHTRLRREAADEMVSCGMVGDAMVEYEALQEYDALVACYRLLGKAQAAEALVTQRLEVEPHRPSLHCTLGDLRNDDAMYERALEVSDNRSVRALRALARSAMGRSDWAMAATRWEAALAINTLHEQGWFALGYCCLKCVDHERALQAFTRAAQLDPENAEAWNNIAAVHMQHDRMEPAYAALGEALKRSRDNWRMWSNYAAVAAVTQHWPQALSAVQRVLALTDNAELPVDVLVRAAGPEGPTPPPPLLGQLLKQAAASNHASPTLWQAYSSYYERVGETGMARECLLKALRALQGCGQIEDLAAVTCQLADVTLRGVEEGCIQSRELGGVRLQLRGLLRNNGEKEGLEAMLARVEAAIQ